MLHLKYCMLGFVFIVSAIFSSEMALDISQPILGHDAEKLIVKTFNNGMKADILDAVKSIIAIGKSLDDNTNYKAIEKFETFRDELIASDVNDLLCLDKFYTLLKRIVEDQEWVSLRNQLAVHEHLDDLDHLVFMHETDQFLLEKYLTIVSRYLLPETDIKFVTKVKELSQIKAFLRDCQALDCDKLYYLEIWILLLFAFNLLEEIA